MLQVYMDESGKAPDETMSIAGLISRPDRWSGFAKDWQRALKMAGLEYFHMREFAHNDWIESKKRQLSKRLLQIIRRRVMFRVCCALDLNAYRRLPESLLMAFKDPYFLCLHTVIHGAVKCCKRDGINEEMQFVFDENKGFEGQALRLLPLIRESLDPLDRYRVGRLSFDDDKKVMPLQAADWIAWEANKEVRERRRRKSFQIMMQSIEGFNTFWDEKRFAGFQSRAALKLSSKRDTPKARA